jgi:hypothetical protein
VGLERGALSLVSTIEELLGTESSGSGVENRQYGRKDPSRCPRGTSCPQKLALTSPRSGGRSVGIVRSWIQATELSPVLGHAYRSCSPTFKPRFATDIAHSCTEEKKCREPV